MKGPHGWYLAHEVGQLAGVSGDTIGQWARRGYIRSSQSTGRPRIYSFQDVAEAIVVHELLERGVRHGDIKRTIHNLRNAYGDWPLTAAPLATTDYRKWREGEQGRELVVLTVGSAGHDIGRGSGAQLLLPALWSLHAVTGLLRRGGWALKDHPEIRSVEVDPDRLSGRPTILNRRISIDKIASIAGEPDGRASLRTDYRLTARQIEDAVKWRQVVEEYERAA